MHGSSAKSDVNELKSSFNSLPFAWEYPPIPFWAGEREEREVRENNIQLCVTNMGHFMCVYYRDNHVRIIFMDINIPYSTNI